MRNVVVNISVHLIMTISFIAMMSSCSINKIAVKALSENFSEGGEELFRSDEDPELVRDSLPLLLKLNELLIEKDPENYHLKASAGKLFIIYSNLFIHIPAGMLDYREWEKQAEMFSRSKKMYIRGSRYLEQSIESKYGNDIDLSDRATVDFPYQKEDVDTLFWLGGGIMSAVSIDVTDPLLSSYRSSAIDIMFLAYELDPGYGSGTLHEYMLQYYGSLPKGMGGSDEKAEFHFRKTLELSEGSRLSPYLSYASVICVKDQSEKGVEKFRKMLETALEIDIDSYPENRLENVIMREKAEWMLENIENYFLVD